MSKQKNYVKKIDALNWPELNIELLKSGFAVTDRIFSDEECIGLRDLYDKSELYRSTIDMKRYNFGSGSYRYFKYPLPNTIQTLREVFYEKLATSANSWSARTKYKQTYPALFSEFSKIMEDLGQTKPTPLILKYVAGDYTCLHQDIANDLIFPYQVIFGLSENGCEYEGGQLILTQQRPRMQTVPYIITIPKGAAVIISSNYHSQLGARGYYRTVFKHGVGKVISGERYTMGIVFHDYQQKPK